VEAIKAEDDLTDSEQHYLELNAELSRDWPVITEMKPAPADAAEWDTVKDKLKYLER
jgi:ferredoxin